MAGSIQSIKRRIRSVESTKKITNAMQLVATSKLRKTRNELDQLKHYYQHVAKTTAEILESNEGLVDHPYLNKNKATKNAYIVISSSLGLCGGYNSNIFKKAMEVIQEEDDIYCIGSKAVLYFKSRYEHVYDEYVDLNTSMDFLGISKLLKHLSMQYLNQDIGAIKIIYTEFVNNLTYLPHATTLLPMSHEKIKEEGQALKSHYYTIFEPSVNEVLDQLIPMYLQATTYGYLVESVTSENASRRMSMEAATDNAEELRENLLLKYNQARQSAITNEILEVIAGANAQS